MRHQSLGVGGGGGETPWGRGKEETTFRGGLCLVRSLPQDEIPNEMANSADSFPGPGSGPAHLLGLWC